MAGNLKQVVERIRNKIPFNKGISRMPVNSLPGFLGDMQNFEYSDGTLKNRLGSRVINFMSDNLWYHIETFQICGVNVTLGLNYKRELWAWLPQWPETDFRVCNSSPFRTYRHTSSATGTSSYTRHFSFTQGNKFWMKEDAQTVIIFSDYGEIFRIMKNGFFRITADEDYADQREAVQDIRDDFNATTGRLYLDIKEATNKVFDERMYIGDEYIRRSHRITGETRFAWVNELNVISELSDPIDIEGYKHVVVSKFQPVPLGEKKAINFERIVKYNGEVNTSSAAQEHTSTGWQEATLVADKWVPAPTYTEEVDVFGFILAVERGYYDDGSGNKTEIPEGVYLCLSTDTGAPTGILPIKPTNTEYNFNAITLPMIDIGREYTYEDEVTFYTAPVLSLGDLAIPSLVKVALGGTDTSDYVEMVSFDGTYNYDETVIDFRSTVGLYSSAYIKLSDSYNSKLFDGNNNYLISNTVSGEYLSFSGRFFETKIKMLTSNPQAGNKMEWSTELVRAIEGADFLSSAGWSFFQNKGYDCWDCVGYLKAVNISSIDIDNGLIYIDNVPDNADIALVCSEVDIWDAIDSLTQRFALWNESHIQGISQRFFADIVNREIVYEGEFQAETNNLNIRDAEINYNDYEIRSAPLMTLDYTGLRRIPMPLPLIRRAMRNPQHIALSGGYVYSIEDGKVWYGSVNDCMMVDSFEVNASIYQVAEFDSGLILATNKGLLFVDVGSPVRSVVRGETIIARFIAPCSGGVIAIEGRDIYIIYKHITDSGAWYPSAIKINPTASEINLEGELKTVSIGKYIYLADDWNLWIYNIDEKMWCGKFNYGSRIHRLFVFNGKLAISFDSGIDRKLAFDRPFKGGK